MFSIFFKSFKLHTHKKYKKKRRRVGGNFVKARMKFLAPLSLCIAIPKIFNPLKYSKHD